MSVVLALFAGSVVHGAEIAVRHPHLIEVFTVGDSPVTGEIATNQQPDHGTTELRVYELDGIQHIEVQLSQGLTADPEESKRIVLQRIQQLDQTGRAQAQRAAMGLAKAMQYGIDRYPAIVLDGEVAIYGVTDIRDALRRYQQWQEDETQ
jgi:integrating conjugative element protein (TIGR03757 family)